MVKLYHKIKVERNYLTRRNDILEKRTKHLKDIIEKKYSCKITFDRIDAIIKREDKLKKRMEIEFEEKGVDGNGRNSNAETQGIQS